MRDDNIDAMAKFDENLMDAINSLASVAKVMAVFEQDHNSDRLEHTLRRINNFLELFNIKITETVGDYKYELKKSLSASEYLELEIIEEQALVTDDE